MSQDISTETQWPTAEEHWRMVTESFNASIQSCIDKAAAKFESAGATPEMAKSFAEFLVIGELNQMGRANFNGPTHLLAAQERE